MKNKKLERILQEFYTELKKDDKATGLAIVAEEGDKEVKYQSRSMGVPGHLGMLLATLLNELAWEYDEPDSNDNEVLYGFCETLKEIEKRRCK